MRVKVFASAILSVLSLTVSANLRTSIVDNVSYSYRLDANGNAILTVSPDSECDEKLRCSHWKEPYSKLRCAVSPKPLGRIQIPQKLDGHEVAKIGDFAFVNCGDISHLVIPETVEEIGLGAFAMCTNMIEVKLADSVTRIGYYAFTGCENLKTVYLPKDLVMRPCDMLILFDDPHKKKCSLAQDFSQENAANILKKMIVWQSRSSI